MYVSEVKDFGVTLVSELRFNKLILKMLYVNMLGLEHTAINDFKNINFFLSLIRSHIESASAV